MKMKNFNNILKRLALVLILPLVTLGCSGDDNNGDNNNDPITGCNQLATFTTEYLEALEDFQANPTEETCIELRTTSLSYLELLQDCPEFYADYSGLVEAIQAWSEIDCSDFGG